ncbi:MAG: DUF1638 domain-containing protein [Candidatus Adiutrix sp.]|jgi:hypothetical protein|nr:DUF1638 domain-containing protein [Candidatus Adiutrix sp.]
MTTRVTLIGCGIFRDEIEHILKEDQPDLDIRWQEVGLHDSIERLEETLDAVVREHRQSGGGPLGFLYGTACLPTMKAFAAERGALVLPAKNCLAALVGEARIKELERNRTLAASVGFVRHMWLGRAQTATGWTADDFRMQFGRYDRIVVLDPGLAPLTDEEILTCFDLVQVPLEIEPCGLDYFRHIFKELLEACAAGGRADAY